MVNESSKIMENLIRLIRRLERDNSINTVRYLSHNIQLVRDIATLACNLLITDAGDCNWPNIEYLKSRGYRVNPIESHAFGWLVGGIFTDKGVITYG